MDLRRVLRILIILEIAQIPLAIVLAFGEHHLLPAGLNQWVEEDANSPTTPMEVVLMALMFPLLAAVVVSWIGLWQLWRPARLIYVISAAVGLVWEALAGPQVSSGIGSALLTLGSIVTGAILALVWFSPLSAAFERPGAAPPGGFDVTVSEPTTASEESVAEQQRAE